MKVSCLILAIVTGLLWWSYSLAAEVTHVYDGDTIKVGRKKVRLVGVDTPEKGWKEKGVKEQCYAKEAMDFLKKFIEGKQVRLEMDPIGDKKDKFGRVLAYVYLGNHLVNAELIKKGYGYAYTHFLFSRAEEFKRYHDEAKAAKRGMWGVCRVECRWHFCESKEK